MNLLELDAVEASDILRSISEDYSRDIILFVISKPRSVEEIAAKEQIPIGTCYRHVHELEAHGIVRRVKENDYHYLTMK